MIRVQLALGFRFSGGVSRLTVVSVLRLVLEPIFVSLGLDSFRSRLGLRLDCYRSRSQPIILRL